MGKVSYRPKKGQQRGDDRRRAAKQEEIQQQSMIEEEANSTLQEEEEKRLTVVSSKKTEEPIQSTKVVGELGDDYHVYIEDYVYTYLYQLAAADFTRESSAVLIGQIYGETKEILIKGIMPIDMDKLDKDTEWINMQVATEMEKRRKDYFKDQQIVGWMHMQPGYGTMLTMKELREHQNVFEGDGTVCMLVDAINKIETVFVYEGEELKEQTGYCMYYERNEEMQQYMLEHPFNAVVKEEMKDNVVNQFREIGKIRKAEYMQRKNLNLTVMAASIILIALTAVIVKMNDGKGVKNDASQLTMAQQQQQLANPIGEGASPMVTPNNLQMEDGKQLQDNIKDETNLGEGAVDKEVASGENDNTDNVKETQPTDKNSEEVNNEVAKGEGESNEVEEYDTYVVEVGDTLADICYKQYGNSLRSLEVAKLNGLSDTNQIYVGQKLKMPK